MRLTLAAFVVLFPGLVAAQPPAPLAGAVPPLPQIGLPLPTIGLPHPRTGLPIAGTALPASAGPAGARTHRRHRRGVPVLPYAAYPFLYIGPAPAIQETSSKAARGLDGDSDRSGRLLIDVEPVSLAQVYVDGYFVGTPEDYRDGIDLPAGTHALEIRAPGFVSAATSLQIPPDRTITYRTTLIAHTGGSSPPASSVADIQAHAPPPVPTVPSTFYVIPGCYLGNVPPQTARLPPDCDPARAITVHP